MVQSRLGESVSLICGPQDVDVGGLALKVSTNRSSCLVCIDLRITRHPNDESIDRESLEHTSPVLVSFILPTLLTVSQVFISFRAGTIATLSIRAISLYIHLLIITPFSTPLSRVHYILDTPTALIIATSR